MKTLLKKLAVYKCEMLLSRITELESMARRQKKIIFENVTNKKKINEILKEKQIQLEALLLVCGSILLVAAALLNVILVLLL